MLQCELIRDLLPLYQDKACSRASREAVDAHVNECEACRALLDEMTAPLPPVASAPPPPVTRMKEARNKLVRKVALIVTAIFCGMGVLVTGGAVGYTELERERFLPYHQIEVTAHEGPNGSIHVDIKQPTRFLRLRCGFYRIDNKDVAVVQLVQSGMRKYFDYSDYGPPWQLVGYGTGLEVPLCGGKIEQPYFDHYYEPELWNPRWEYPGRVDAVYYGAFSEHGFNNTEDWTLLWERGAQA